MHETKVNLQQEFNILNQDLTAADWRRKEDKR